MKFLKTNTLKRTVKCRVPHPDQLDEFVEAKFVADLRLISQAAVEELVKKVDEATGEEKAKSTQAFFDEVVIAVAEIDDETGAVKPATDEAKALVREHPIACQAAAFAVFEAITEGVARKNSKR